MKEKTKRFLAVILCFLMVLTSVGIYHRSEAAENGLTLSDITILVDGEPLQNGQTVNNGSVVSIGFEWNIANDTSDPSSEFSVDLGAQGITLTDYPLSDLKNDAGRVVGKYQIIDGVLTVFLNEDYLEESELSGYAHITGVVDVEQESEGDATGETIGFGDKTYLVDVDFNEPDSYLNVSKNAVGSAVPDGDGQWLTQEFEVSMTAYNGSVSNLTLEDFPGAMLGEPYEINFNGTIYESIDALNEALQGMVLENKETLTFSYKAKVSAEAYASDKAGQCNNRLHVSYESSQNNPKSSESYSGASVNRPSISKRGVLDEENKKITWTVALHLGDFSLDDIESLWDALGEYLSFSDGSAAGDSNVNIEKGELTAEEMLAALVEQMGAEYSYDPVANMLTLTYETDVADEAFGTVAGVNAANSIETKVGEYSYGANASVAIPKAPAFLEKTLVDASFTEDDASAILTYQVEINIPEGLTSLSISDRYYTNNGDASLSFDGNLYLDGVLVVENGALTEAGKLVLASYNTWSEGSFDLSFTEDYLREHAGERVLLTYTMRTSGNRERVTFTNLISSRYTVNGENASYPVQEVDWMDNRALDKSGTVQDDSTIDYTITVNLERIMNLEVGKVVTLEDTLPEGLTLIDNPTFAAYRFVNIWYSEYLESCNPELTSVKQNGNRLTISFVITEAMMEKLLAIQDGSGESMQIRVSYSMRPEDPVEFLKQDGGTYVNVVQGKCGSENLGSNRVSNTMKPAPVVEKTQEYLITHPDYVAYTITVNPDALKLSDSEWIEGEDVMGSALILDAASVAVSAWDAEAEEWKPLTAGEDYRFTYDPATNKTVYLLPDATYLKITYHALINLKTYQDSSKNEWLTPENSGNAFSISGFQSDAAESTVSLDMQSYSLVVGAYSETGSITLFKYWNDEDGQMLALNGSEFKLVENELDPATGTLTETDRVITNIKVEENGEIFIDELKYDTIYTLYETKAPSGFVCATEPYYFVITGSAQVDLSKLSSDIHVREFRKSGLPVYFENTPGETPTPALGSISIQKNDGDGKGLDGVEFTLYNDISLSDDSIVEAKTTSDGGKLSFTDLEPGDYYIKETKALEGYVVDETVYHVVISRSEANEVTVTINDGTVTLTDETLVVVNVTATPTPTPALGSISIQKNDGDGKGLDGVEFTLYNDISLSDDSIVEAKTTSDGGKLSFTDLEPGDYYIKETKALEGYVVDETVYHVVISRSEANEVTITINDGTVTITDETLVVVNVTATPTAT
ncbi:MAG: SpaA isopeptide-forming pilin-related protein, partial [Lachnospiraceae bacterium]|nr:SpaA isopeptide-forming pilin-related protein [Lachnospiraceae bacterium]